MNIELKQANENTPSYMRNYATKPPESLKHLIDSDKIPMGKAFDRIKSELMFLHKPDTEEDQGNEEESFNALDSPDFMKEYIEEKKDYNKPSSIFFKHSGFFYKIFQRGDILYIII